MERRHFLRAFAAAPLTLHTLAQETRPPNIIFIMADDLGYGDLGCYGQKLIKTPRLDQMAAEGIRFTDFYAGATVCAPSRCVLMTGKHHGQCQVRGNATTDMTVQSLRSQDVTVAEVAKKAGYGTALMGKWGLGEAEHEGHPLKKGFDRFYGYLNQVHAHNYYPEFLWRDYDKVPLRNKVKLAPRAGGGFHGGYAIERLDYTHDLVVSEALEWVDNNHTKPFFLYLALTLPHANNEAPDRNGELHGQEVPEYGIYEGNNFATEDWKLADRGQAAMVSRMDRDIGRLLDRLKQHGIDENTLVMFTSDNGPHLEGGNDAVLFNPSGPLRGMKRDMYEGGLRVPMIARWPGKIAPGRVSHHIGYSGDLMATVAELTRSALPQGTHSVSFLPELLGNSSRQRKHDYLYWEFYEQGSAQAVRYGKWKGVRKPMFKGPIELYNLEGDPGEKYNIARNHPEIVREIEAIMAKAHVPHPNWKVG
ncbi:MAG: arylsulfatase [Bryobacterales bacterium]|nr:arylsulfatase [Bryobacterales bacterium]